MLSKQQDSHQHSLFLSPISKLRTCWCLYIICGETLKRALSYCLPTLCLYFATCQRNVWDFQMSIIKNTASNQTRPSKFLFSFFFTSIFFKPRPRVPTCLLSEKWDSVTMDISQYPTEEASFWILETFFSYPSIIHSDLPPFFCIGSLLKWSTLYSTYFPFSMDVILMLLYRPVFPFLCKENSPSTLHMPQASIFLFTVILLKHHFGPFLVKMFLSHWFEYFE